MKNVILFISVLVLVSLKAIAQAPAPPAPPETSNTGTSYSISINGDDHDKYSNTSVSIKKTETTYKFTARFNKSRTNEVQDALLKSLGASNLEKKGSTYIWSTYKQGDEEFECKLTKGNLRMTVDKELASAQFYKKIEALGIELKDLISGTDSKATAQKKLERAKKDLERAQRDLQRAEKELSRRSKG